MKITYKFVTGEVVEIEVSEGIGEVSIALDKDVYNSDRRETRRHSSLEELREQGAQLGDDVDVSFFIEQQEISEALHDALHILSPQQRKLVREVFFKERTIVDIARAEGVSESAIRDRLKRIYKKMKNILK